MKYRAPLGRDGLALVFVLMVVLAITGLATVGLNLALAEARLASAVGHRVGSDLLAEGTVALAMWADPSETSPPSVAFGASGFSLESAGAWESGDAGASLSWLSSEVALIRAWGRTRGAPSERWAGTLGWVLDPSVQLAGNWAPVAVGGTMDAPTGFAPAIDTCGLPPTASWGPGPLPDRWNSPLDLALGWRGPRPPTATELEKLSSLDRDGSLLLLGDGAAAGLDSAGPVLAVAPGDLTLVPESYLSGLLMVAGDLRIAPTARFVGVARVLGRMTVDSGAELVVSPCRASRGLERTGWGEGLRPVHGFVGLMPL